MHPAIATRRARNTQPIEVALSMIQYLAARRAAVSALMDPPYESHAFVWPASYEEGLRRRTYTQVSRSCERADCGCLVPHTAVYVDPRNTKETICAMHGNIVCCAECGQPTGETITPATEALSKARQVFYCLTSARRTSPHSCKFSTRRLS